MLPRFTIPAVLFLAATAVAEPPRLVRSARNVDLIVNGKPWLILGGELRNSSPSTLEFMRPVWPHLESLNVNTVFAPVSWKLLEPRRDEFDFALLDGLITGARDRNLRLILLWMGAWKNGVSGYAPNWVLTDPRTYPRMSPTVLSPFGEATLREETRAFRALLAHLRAFDGERNTVLMVQVENEVGVPTPSRDTSPSAEAAFQGHVPTALIEQLSTHEADLKPYVRNLWIAGGRRRTGSWQQVFGDCPETDDLFMAWHYAAYIGRLAAAGKAEYPLPMYVNACLLKGDTYQRGADPSGGPTNGVLDIWMAAAPAIDLYGVDNYRRFKQHCQSYRHRGNPLFMPEACSWWGDDPYSGPAKAFYSFGEHHALAFSPFGIDNRMYAGHLLSLAYEKLASLAPLLVQHRGRPSLRGFYRDGDEKGETFDFEGVRASVTYRTVPRENDRYGSFGLIIQSGSDEFFVAGRGFTVRFSDARGDRQSLINLGVEEGHFEEGRWHVRRHLNGDEVGGQGAETVLTPAPFSKQPVIGEEEITILRLRIAHL